MKKKAFLLFFTLLALSLYGWMNPKTPDISQAQSTKLYWFIPDGLRADPYQFNIFKWAQEGKLPNIKYLMENGSYGFSIPVFPGHTPSNFASLFTGVFPKDHGITDGPLRLHGYPLRIVSKSGFSSTSKLLNPIWYTLEQNNISSTLLSVPGSTPPEIEEGNIIKGRWGNWGINFPAIIFHSEKDTLFRKQLSINDRVFNLGKKLTQFIEFVKSSERGVAK